MPPPERRVLVTGASSGIGAAVARRFAHDGAAVVLVARRAERLESVAREVVELGGRAHVLVADVSDRIAIEQGLGALPADFAEVDVLVNGAGLAVGLELAHEAKVEDWEQMIDVNVKGLAYVTRAILGGMAARDRGHVINLGSVAASYPYPGGNVYGATKAFVKQFSLNLRADLLGKNIRVTDIEPGMVETEFSVVRFRGDEERAAAVYRGVKVLSADDVAELVHYCANVPAHINVNRLEVMPVMQAFAPFAVKRS